MKADNQKKLRKAIVYAIAEDLVQQLVWSEELQRMILPEGVALCYEQEVVDLAKKELNVKI